MQRLRREGVTPTEIAKRLGMSRMSVYRIITPPKESVDASPDDDVVRSTWKREAARVDAAMRAARGEVA